MQSINDLLEKREGAIALKSRRTERSDLVDYFFLKIRPEYENYSKRKMKYAYMCQLLSPIGTGDLYILKKKCDEAKTFGKCFWYFVKPKVASTKKAGKYK